MSPPRLLKGANREIKCFQRVLVGFLTPKAYVTKVFFSYPIQCDPGEKGMACTIDFMAVNIRMKTFISTTVFVYPWYSFFKKNTFFNCIVYISVFTK